MKVLFVPTSYPDETNQTRDIFIQEQAVALSKAGHDVRVLHAQKQLSRDIFHIIHRKIKVTTDAHSIIRYYLPVKTFMESKIIEPNKKAFVKTIDLLFNAVISDGWTPDVIYAHFSCWAGYAAVVIGKKYSIPVVVMEHYSGFMSDSTPCKMVQGLKFVADNADAMICVSDNLKESVIKKSKTNKQIFTIPNMLDPRFKYLKHITGSKIVFSTVCNLNSRKRVTELVSAFCKAFGEKDNVELIIGGEGPEKKKIQECIEQNHRDHQIILLGRLDREGTVNLYQKSNCFVLVSAHETFGIVWREAMATGLPVITSNHEGWSKGDWFDDFGIMVPVDDEDCLVAALIKMKSQYSFYDGRRISEYCRAHYSEEVVVNQIENIFNKVCRSTKS